MLKLPPRRSENHRRCRISSPQRFASGESHIWARQADEHYVEPAWRMSLAPRRLSSAYSASIRRSRASTWATPPRHRTMGAGEKHAEPPLIRRRSVQRGMARSWLGRGMRVCRAAARLLAHHICGVAFIERVAGLAHDAASRAARASASLCARRSLRRSLPAASSGLLVGRPSWGSRFRSRALHAQLRECRSPPACVAWPLRPVPDLFETSCNTRAALTICLAKLGGKDGTMGTDGKAAP
jgi:hypothetical protein